MARVYVGTYEKYNNGSISGKWLDLEDYVDHDDFIEACRELHKDEEDPELMFQDIEGFPEAYYDESSINPEVWEWLELDDDERSLVGAYLDGVSSSDDLSTTLNTAQEKLVGLGNSAKDVIEQWADDVGILNEVPDNLKYYFDWDSYTRDILMSDCFDVEYDGQTYVFYH